VSQGHHHDRNRRAAFERVRAVRMPKEACAAALRSAQSLRSASSAHRKGSDLDKTIRKLGFEGVPRSRIILGLVVGVREALERAIAAA